MTRREERREEPRVPRAAVAPCARARAGMLERAGTALVVPLASRSASTSWSGRRSIAIYTSCKPCELDAADA